MSKAKSSKTSIDFIANVRFAWFLPIVVLLLQQIASFLDRPTVNQHPSGLYWFFWNLYTAIGHPLLLVGIVWGLLAWKRTEGKVAFGINLIALFLL